MKLNELVSDIIRAAMSYQQHMDFGGATEAAKTDLDNLVSKLNSRVTELEAAQRWIPVSERLPERDGYYLITNSYTSLGYFFDGVWRYSPIHPNNQAAFPVTHWMPIPEPPDA